MLFVAIPGWKGAAVQHFQRPESAAEIRELAAIRSPAAAREGRERLLPRLRAAREVFGADDRQVSALLNDCPQFWSTPLEKTLLPRHAWLASRGHPNGRALLLGEQRGLRQLLLR
jgi:hypothetical protein